jgi:hypothetical protein
MSEEMRKALKELYIEWKGLKKRINQESDLKAKLEKIEDKLEDELDEDAMKQVISAKREIDHALDELEDDSAAEEAKDLETQLIRKLIIVHSEEKEHWHNLQSDLENAKTRFVLLENLKKAVHELYHQLDTASLLRLQGKKGLLNLVFGASPMIALNKKLQEAAASATGIIALISDVNMEEFKALHHSCRMLEHHSKEIWKYRQFDELIKPQHEALAGLENEIAEKFADAESKKKAASNAIPEWINSILG